MSKLVWNAIVKNEAAIIERCVSSLLPHVDGAVFVDTGSEDGTPYIIERMFKAAGKPAEWVVAEFVNFAQARNVALEAARTSVMDWDYLLLADADMELKVHKPDWLNGAKGLSYDIKQTAGSVGYYNRRVVSCAAQGHYVGVTHEYLDVATDGCLDGVEFIDHADGANRPDKFSRDIALLKKALETETNEGLIQRYHFYLGQSYFDNKDWAEAAKYYQRRTMLGGFDEEVWNAQLHYAHCLENLGDKPGFLWELLRAYELRPGRAEPLYDLAKYFRERGENKVSLLFSKPGMRVPYPKDDLLFVNNYVYHSGLREEYAISAYYDPLSRGDGALVCNALALDRQGTHQSREQARTNQYWYLQPLAKRVESFAARPIEFEPEKGWVPMNPSVVNRDGEPLVLVRTVNYRITPEGVYAIRGRDGTYSREHPINTRNYLVALDHGLNVTDIDEITLPLDWPEARYHLVRGFEDSRLFEWQGDLWTLSTVRELNAEGWCEQVLAPVFYSSTSETAYGPWQPIILPNRHNEKNWMPWVKKDGLRFVYRIGTLVDSQGMQVFHRDPDLDVGHISGGSQVCNAEGVHIAVVHEARHIPGSPCRYYQHRFATFANDGRMLRLSPPFVFHDRQIEFAAGLAWFPDKRQLMVSYGVRDCEAWIATMDLDDVIAFIAEGT